jgi:hypothetical protein
MELEDRVILSLLKEDGQESNREEDDEGESPKPG